MADQNHKLEYLPIDKVKPNSWNPNQEDEAAFDALVNEVAETGLISPITVVPIEDGTYRIIGGEHRWRAAKATGMDTIPALVLAGKKWNDETLQKFVTVRLNMLHGKLNPEKFIKLYNEMAELHGQEQLQKLFGFTDKNAYKRAVKGIVAKAKKDLPPEAQAELEERARAAKTIDNLGEIVQELYSRHGETANLSYMIFTHGRDQHVYIKMTTKTRKALDKVFAYCAATQTDVNDVLGEIIQEGVKTRAKKLEAETKAAKAKPPIVDPFE